jgi:hypothetical protein
LWAANRRAPRKKIDLQRSHQWRSHSRSLFVRSQIVKQPKI